MKTIKKKFFICLLIFSMVFYFAGTPRAHAWSLGDWLTGGLFSAADVAHDLFKDLVSTNIFFFVDPLTVYVACQVGVPGICQDDNGGGGAVPNVDNLGCVFQIPVTFYDWQQDAKYGYPAFYYLENSHTGYPEEGDSPVYLGNEQRYKDSACTNGINDPYTSDNKYARVGNDCVPILPTNVFKYNTGKMTALSLDDGGQLVPGVPIYEGIGFSPHYRDSACTDLIPDPSSPDIYAKVSGVGCVSTANPYSNLNNNLTYQYTYPYDQYQQVKIYRYTLPIDKDPTTDNVARNNWFINTIKANAGNGFSYMSISYTGDTDGYLTSTQGGQLVADKPFSDLCVGNVCKFPDNTVPENSYVAYVAKVTGNYTMAFADYGNGIGTGDIISQPFYEYVTKENKFLNTDNAPDSASFPSRTIGNAIYGPYKTGICPPILVPAVCGSANGTTVSSAPTAGTLCSGTDTASVVSLSGGNYTWTCTGPSKTPTYQCPSNNNTAGSKNVCGAPYTCNGQTGTESTCVGSDHGDPCQFYHTYDCVKEPSGEGATATCSAGGAGANGACANGASDYPTCGCGPASKVYLYGSSSYGSDTQCLAGVSSNTVFPTASLPSAWLCLDANGQPLSGMCLASVALQNTTPGCTANCVVVNNNCSKSCGGGTKVVSFCTRADCTIFNSKTEACNSQPCPPGYREVTPW